MNCVSALASSKSCIRTSSANRKNRFRFADEIETATREAFDEQGHERFAVRARMQRRTPVRGERARIVEALEIRDHVVEALGAQKERIRESFDQHFLRLATERRSRRNAKIP